MFKLKNIVILLLLLSFTGCNYSYNVTPNSSTYNIGTIVEFSTNNQVNLINVQKSTQIVLGTSPVETMNANLHEWTDVSIQILKKEFLKRGIISGDKSAKTIYISVEKAKMDLGMLYNSCEIFIKVTIDDYSQVYYGRSNAISYLDASSSAMTEAVTNILRDNTVIKYLVTDK